MASKVIAQAKKDAACARICAGQSTNADEARRLNVSQEIVRRWRKDYIRRHPEAAPKPVDPAPIPAAAPSPDAPPPPPVELDGGLDAARAAAGLPPVAGPAPGSAAAAASPPPVQPQVVGAITQFSSRQEDEDLTFFYASLLVSGEVRLPLLLMTAKKPYKVVMTPALESMCVLTNGEKEALRPAAPLIARKIREMMGSSENATWAGVVLALGYGAMDRITAVVKAVRDAAAAYERDHAPGGPK